MAKPRLIRPEDENAIIQASLKDPQAFRTIYDLHYHHIFRFVNNRIGEINISADIVSEVFYKALTKLEKYTFKGLSIRVWLVQIAYNETMMHFRDQKKQRLVSIDGENIEMLCEEEDLEPLKDFDTLKKALDQLNDSELNLIEMRYFEKRSHREIASILDISENNAKVKSHRALNTLRTLFNK